MKYAIVAVLTSVYFVYFLLC